MRLRRSVIALSVLATLAAFTALPTPPAYADTTTDTYIVQLKHGVTADAVVPKLMGNSAKVVRKVFQGGIADLNAAQAKALAQSPYVKSVHKDAVISAAATEVNAPWDLDMFDSPTAALDGSYTYPNDGSRVSVYVLDSGIQRSHVQFSGANIAAGYNFVENNSDTSDCAGHGTAVSSIIAGVTLGAAKGVTLVPLRVLNCYGQGKESDIIRAAEWIAQNRTPSAPAAANLSFGTSISQLNGDTSLEDAFQGLINNGVTVVAAAGNGGVDACTESPASLSDAITVASANKLHAESSWSNNGSCVDLYAPGESVNVASATSIYSTAPGSGTSFSAPLTSGAAAIVLHDHPTWTPAQVSAEIEDQALDGVVTGPAGLAARSANKLLHVTGKFAGTDPTITGAPGMVVSLTPSRLLDTRSGLGATTGPLHDGQTVRLPVAGVAGVASTASAVLVNITVTDATSPGFVTAYAWGNNMPATSNGNFTVGRASANLALVPVGSDGAIALSVRLSGTVQLVVDVQSYIAGGVVTDAGAVVPVTPTRLWDTREHAVLSSGATLPLHVAGVAGVPADATAVFVNVTVTQPQAYGYLTVFPAGEAVPATSNLNFVPGLTAPNLALVKVGKNESISIQNGSPGAAHVVVDIQGYITAGTPTTAGAVIPISPVRIVDTRLGLGAKGPVSSGTAVVVTVTGASVPTTSQGVFMNLTVTDPKSSGWLAAYPTQATLPLVSNVNFVGGQTVPNLATVGLTNGQATLHNGSGGTVQMVADVFAYIL